MTTDVGGRSVDNGGTLSTVLGIAGVVLAVAVMLFRPALPYEIDSLLEIALLLCLAAASVWLVTQSQSKVG